MAAAITVSPDEPHVGEPVVIAGTGFAATHACTIAVDELGVTLKVTSDGSGDFSSTAVATLVPQSDVPLNISVSDGTSTLTKHVEVFTG